MSTLNLLFVAGASPQIITETVYAMAQGGGRSGKVFVLTTLAGRAAIERELLASGGGWSSLRREYGSTRGFKFAKNQIFVLRDSKGQPLQDVRTEADNNAAADQIAEQVKRLTREGAPPLHASIAGGRKTMGYCLAAAMMLYGRPEDRLSHVLVRPAEVEGSNFYFPPKGSPARTVGYRKAGGKLVKVRAADIGVDLAELPFPRLRAVRDLRERSGANFSVLVEQLQTELDVLTAKRVSVQPEEGVALCGGRAVPLSTVRAGIYALLAQRRRDGCGQAACSGCAACFVSGEDVEGWFRQRLSAWTRSQGSYGVSSDKWGLRNFLPELPKINAALRRRLKGGSAPYEIKMWGPKGARHHGLTLQPGAITVTWG